MDRFQAMKVFMAVVDTNSFTKAADIMNLPRATVTMTIQNLEDLLKVRLLNRTTRSVSLTHDGAAYYERCSRIIADLEETEAAFHDVAQRPRGRLRVDVPGAIGRLVLIPNLREFHTQYPDVELIIGMGDRPVDLVQEGVDCVIRGGELMDSTLVARRIGTLNFLTCGSPLYFERYGVPHTLNELADHKAVHYFSNRTNRNIDWDFIVDGVSTEIRMRGAVAVNDGGAYIDCGLRGFGLIQAPRFMALPYLQSGELVEVLSQWKPAPLPLSALYPQNRHLSPKVRAFVDWAAGLFSSCPLLNGSDESSHQVECKYNTKSSGNTVRAILEQQNIAESNML